MMTKAQLITIVRKRMRERNLTGYLLWRNHLIGELTKATIYKFINGVTVERQTIAKIFKALDLPAPDLKGMGHRKRKSKPK